jgi:uncharacterized protein YecE (DUF72 family)
LGGIDSFGHIRQADPDFVYTIKVCELITHIKRFEETETLIKDFGYVADLLGAQMGCFLYQLPPSVHCSLSTLQAIVSQLDPRRRNVVGFVKAGGTKKSTNPSDMQGRSFAPAAVRGFPTN